MRFERERAVAQVLQDRYPVGRHAAYDDIRRTIPVHVPHRHVPCASGDGVIISGPQGPFSVVHEKRDGIGRRDRARDVEVPVPVQVRNPQGARISQGPVIGTAVAILDGGGRPAESVRPVVRSDHDIGAPTAGHYQVRRVVPVNVRHHEQITFIRSPCPEIWKIIFRESVAVVRCGPPCREIPGLVINKQGRA